MIPPIRMIDLQRIIDRLFDEMVAGWRLD